MDAHQVNAAITRETLTMTMQALEVMLNSPHLPTRHRPHAHVDDGCRGNVHGNARFACDYVDACAARKDQFRRAHGRAVHHHGGNSPREWKHAHKIDAPTTGRWAFRYTDTLYNGTAKCVNGFRLLPPIPPAVWSIQLPRPSLYYTLVSGMRIVPRSLL